MTIALGPVETSGTGNTDRGVVFFRDLRGGGTHELEARLPLLPLAYFEDSLLQIRWLVRARRLQTLAEDQIVDEGFRVDLPAP